MNATDADELAAACARLNRALGRLGRAETAYRDTVLAVRGRIGYGASSVIARHLGVHRVTIAKLAKGADPVPQGVGRAVAELTDTDKALLDAAFAEYTEADRAVNGDGGAYLARTLVLRRLHSTGAAGVAELARATGASETTIGDIVNAAGRGSGRSRTDRRRAAART